MLMEGEQTLLQCPLGQYVSFTSARYFYGGCGADVTRALQINCCNRSSCLIQATNAWVGVDPCVGDTKFLEWNMVCEGKHIIHPVISGDFNIEVLKKRQNNI